MNVLPWKPRRLEFVPAELKPEEEWERDGVGEVHYKPLYWTMDAPRVTKAANFYVGRVGESEYILVRIQPGDDYARGLRFFGPLPEPRA